MRPPVTLLLRSGGRRRVLLANESLGRSPIALVSTTGEQLVRLEAGEAVTVAADDVILPVGEHVVKVEYYLPKPDAPPELDA
jgi:hypothetical protein